MFTGTGSVLCFADMGPSVRWWGSRRQQVYKEPHVAPWPRVHACMRAFPRICHTGHSLSASAVSSTRVTPLNVKWDLAWLLSHIVTCNSLLALWMVLKKPIVMLLDAVATWHSREAAFIHTHALPLEARHHLCVKWTLLSFVGLCVDF